MVTSRDLALRHPSLAIFRPAAPPYYTTHLYVHVISALAAIILLLTILTAITVLEKSQGLPLNVLYYCLTTEQDFGSNSGNSTETLSEFL